MGFLKIPVAGHTLQLPPRFAPRMPIGPDIAPSHPAVGGAILIRTELLPYIDRASATTGAHEQGGRDGGSRWTGRGGVHTRVTKRLVDEARKRLWVFGTCLNRPSGRGRRLAWRGA